jgi:hypothetical protein
VLQSVLDILTHRVSPFTTGVSFSCGREAVADPTVSQIYLAPALARACGAPLLAYSPVVIALLGPHADIFLWSVKKQSDTNESWIINDDYTLR